MNKSILICDPCLEFCGAAKKALLGYDCHPVVATNGKQAQIEAHLNRFDAVVIDIKTKDSSGFDLLKYINLNSQSSKVFFTFEDEALLKNLGINLKSAPELGINFLFKKPYKVESLLEYLSALEQAPPKKSKNVNDNKLTEDATDKDFAQLPILNYYSGNLSVVDLFIRLAPNKYVKVLHRGDFITHQEIQELHDKKKVSYLYFKTDDRRKYVTHVNAHLKRYLDLTDPSPKKAINLTSTLVDQYVDEVNYRGISSRALEEASIVCENVYKTLKNRKMYEEYFVELQKSPGKLSHIFLTTIFSSITAMNTEWATRVSHDYVIKGALLHDIGMMKLPQNLRTMKKSKMSASDRSIYNTHPTEGYNILSPTDLPHQVKQIVYQHHECINGEGYPNGLSGIRIFPLAKIVSFAADFAEYIIERGLTPKAGLQEILVDRTIICRYDPEVIKSFIKGFPKAKLK